MGFAKSVKKLEAIKAQKAVVNKQISKKALEEAEKQKQTAELQNALRGEARVRPQQPTEEEKLLDLLKNKPKSEPPTFN